VLCTIGGTLIRLDLILCSDLSEDIQLKFDIYPVWVLFMTHFWLHWAHLWIDGTNFSVFSPHLKLFKRSYSLKLLHYCRAFKMGKIGLGNFRLKSRSSPHKSDLLSRCDQLFVVRQVLVGNISTFSLHYLMNNLPYSYCKRSKERRDPYYAIYVHS
jgi:hypothetical protein